MEQDHNEMHLFSFPTPQTPSSSASQPPLWQSDSSTRRIRSIDQYDGPSLDLKLSISVTPFKPPSNVLMRKVREYNNNNNNNNDVNSDSGCVEALKWQAAEQFRLAAMEKAYAERMRELTRREMELAQSEFSRARNMWERAREEVERAEKMKERATRKVDSTEFEITCQSCRQKFRP